MSELFPEGKVPPKMPEETAAFYRALSDEMAIYTCVNDFIQVAMRHAIKNNERGINPRVFGMAVTTALQELGFHR